MKHNREFEIAWQGLKPGEHVFNFEIGDKFMLQHEAPEEYSNWHASVRLVFDKHDSFFQLHFDIGGSVNVICDRCGDRFDLQLWDEFDLLVKLLSEKAEQNEPDEEADIVFIPRNETVLNLSNWIYEFVMLSIPIHKVHPEDKNGEPSCNAEALALLKTLAPQEEAEQSPANSIWKGLEAIRNLPKNDTE